MYFMEKYTTCTIMNMLHGETPDKKLDYLSQVQNLLYQIAYPRKGFEEENWSFEDIKNKAATLINQSRR